MDTQKDLILPSVRHFLNQYRKEDLGLDIFFSYFITCFNDENLSLKNIIRHFAEEKKEEVESFHGGTSDRTKYEFHSIEETVMVITSILIIKVQQAFFSGGCFSSNLKMILDFIKDQKDSVSPNYNFQIAFLFILFELESVLFDLNFKGENISENQINMGERCHIYVQNELVSIMIEFLDNNQIKDSEYEKMSSKMNSRFNSLIKKCFTRDEHAISAGSRILIKMKEIGKERDTNKLENTLVDNIVYSLVGSLDTPSKIDIFIN